MTAEPAAATASTRGFEVVLPPDWVRLDASDKGRDRLDAIAATMIPEQAATLRPELKATIQKTLDELAAGGVMAVIMQGSTLNLAASPAVLVVRPLMLPESTGPLDYLLALAASDSSATLLDAENVVILKTHVVDERIAPALVTELPAASSRRPLHLRYLVGLPTHDDAWAEVFGTVDVVDAEHADDVRFVYGVLIDEILKTWRWSA